MKIEIEIDIEAIVRQEIRSLIAENLVIKNVPASIRADEIQETGPTSEPQDEVTITIESSLPAIQNAEYSREVPAPPGIRWEYSAKPGRRRSKADIALHELELSKGRLLTPIEKGETHAIIEVDDEAEEAAKVAAKERMRIDGIAQEGMAAASRELAEEAKAAETVEEPLEVIGAPEESHMATIAAEVDEPVVQAETIPKADSLGNLDSLFN